MIDYILCFIAGVVVALYVAYVFADCYLNELMERHLRRKEYTITVNGVRHAGELPEITELLHKAMSQECNYTLN